MKPSEKLFAAAERANVPLSCTFELTRRCNLNCRHCYIDRNERAGEELTTAGIKKVLRQLAGAGTLHLVFTGGEIFLRDDIIELCRFARSLKFELRLFTNGTCIDGKIAAALASHAVSGVELSLYGRETTHDTITRSSGSFSKTITAIRLLKDAGLAVTVKAPLMTLNFKDRHWLIALADELGVRHRFDPTIAPRDSGDHTNLKYRLTPSQLRQLYADSAFNPSRTEGKDAMPSGSDDLSCSAGRTLIAIASGGTVYPCLQLLLPVGNVRHHPLSRIWSDRNKVLAGYRRLSAGDLRVCSSCGDRAVCQRCPGLALLEDRDLLGPSKIACTLARVQRAV